MKKLLIATATAAALLAGVGAASAQTFQNDGPDISRQGTMTERGVGLRTAPVGYSQGWTQDQARTGSPVNTEAFRSQELMPQSPPSGGY